MNRQVFLKFFCTFIMVIGLMQMARAQAPIDSGDTQEQILQMLDQTADWYRNLDSLRATPDNARETVVMTELKRNAAQVLGFGFDYARAKASTLSPVVVTDEDDQDDDSQKVDASKIAAFTASVNAQLTTLQAQLNDVNAQIKAAPAGAARSALYAQRRQVAGALSFAQAQHDLLSQVKGFLNGNQADTDKSLIGSINSMEQGFPEIRRDANGFSLALDTDKTADNGATGTAKTGTTTTPTHVNGNPGILAAIGEFFPLWRKRNEIDQYIKRTEALEKDNDDRRKATRMQLQALIKQGKATVVTLVPAAAIAPTAPSTTSPATPAPTQEVANAKPAGPTFIPAPPSLPHMAAPALAITKVDKLPSIAPVASTPAQPAALVDLGVLAVRLREVTAMVVPLTQQHQSLQDSHASLTEWRGLLNRDFTTSLWQLIVRLVILAILIAIPLGVSEIAQRATNRYIKDARRRRQLRTVRRTLVGVLITIVVFVSLFSEVGSFATYAGLLTAGMAVALQNVILSAFCYFFLLGRFGIRVGEHVTVSTTTGEVIEVGLLRIYIMEMANNTATGRIAVFPNLIFFQPSAFYKQVIGTNYIWHDITLHFVHDVDQGLLRSALLKAAGDIYADYHADLQKQHAALENATHLRVDMPRPDCTIEVLPEGVACTVHYPLELGREKEIDKRMNDALMTAVQADARLKLAGAAT